MAKCAGLGGNAAAVHPRNNIHPRFEANRLKRRADDPLQRRAGEELLKGFAVDQVGAGARLQDHSGDGGLALAGGGIASAGGEVDLAKWPTMVDPVYKSKDEYKTLLEDHVAKLGALQELHWASNRHAVLLILQAPDVEVARVAVGQ